MRILVTGGAGNIGVGLVPALLTAGHEVVVLDREPGALEPPSLPGLAVVRGAVEDRASAEEALRGAEAVLHLAWSFSEDPAVLLERDLRGHQLLLETARRAKVRHFLYASTAVVYGKPLRLPVDEDHPQLVLEARRPSYGLAKDFAEKLTLLADRTGGPPATIFRFWWAFGSTIGGRHLREMLRAAARGERLVVPAGCGGSFVSIEDLAQAVQLALENPAALGRVFNVASAYVGWDEVARLVADATGSRAGVEVVPLEGWRGPAFLAEAWRLDDGLIRARLGYRPRRDDAGLRDLLGQAIARTWEAERRERPA